MACDTRYKAVSQSTSTPTDAKRKASRPGDVVRVFNDRGQLLAGAVLMDSYAPGVVRIEEGNWYGPIEKVGAR
ncbi:hypothetical protein O9929_18960 [Vibrio lentus]|nr:hypothetical protein [Vibrio lentus]